MQTLGRRRIHGYIYTWIYLVTHPYNNNIKINYDILKALLLKNVLSQLMQTLEERYPRVVMLLTVLTYVLPKC